MSVEYSSREESMHDLKEQYHDGRFADAVSMLQDHEYEADDQYQDTWGQFDMTEDMVYER